MTPASATLLLVSTVRRVQVGVTVGLALAGLAVGLVGPVLAGTGAALPDWVSCVISPVESTLSWVRWVAAIGLAYGVIKAREEV